MRSGAVIAANAREANLKRKLRAHFKSLGFTKSTEGLLVPPALDKESYRRVHSHQREARLLDSDVWLRKRTPDLISYFANGKDVTPEKITPRLELASGGTLEGDIFRMASLSWRIPVSDGYGRRLRFLVWDDHNDKLIGLIALGDAVFNLKARDAAVGWDHHQRVQSLVHMMDAYVLGAVPPYNFLLGGKLVASLVRSREVVSAFDAKYRESVGIISKKRKKPRLVAVTTTSALGRSSVYNRLRLGGRSIFEPIGYTSGWGHFHISDGLFEELREYLVAQEDLSGETFEFGQGPNWRIRLIKNALSRLGMDKNLVQHGMAREVFLCRLAQNAEQFLRGEHVRVRYGELPSVEQVSSLAIDRWIVPRSQRSPEFRQWEASSFLEALRMPTNRESSSTTSEASRGMGA